MSEKQLYVWNNVLTDYTSGMAVVLAESVEDAYSQVREQRDNGELRDYIAEELLANEPEPSDGVEWIYGGA